MIFLKLQLVFLKRSLANVSLEWSAKITPSCDCSVIATLLSSMTKAGRQDCKHIFFLAKLTRQVFCSFLSAPMCGKSCKHSFNTEVIVDFSISRAWTPHAIFLSDRNDPLWECWYNLSNLTNQRVYQELVYRNGSFKRNDDRLRRPFSSQFPPILLRLRALWIQRAQLSRSLERATKSATDSPPLRNLFVKVKPLNDFRRFWSQMILNELH